MNTRSRNKQRGAALLLISATLLLVAVTTLVIKQTKAIKDANNRTKVTNDNLETVRKALTNYVTINGRLPCPANGAIAEGGLNFGVALPATSAQNCNFPAGVVPWMTLGMAQAASMDGWGKMITYRVYQGATGMTTANGADMTNCDTLPPTPIAATAPNYLCAIAHTTSGSSLSPIGFLGAYRPGFTVFDRSNNQVRQVGFVLISHGASGYGARTSGGGQSTLPAVANTAEFANTQTGTTYYRQPYSDATIQPTANNHFDDEVVYMTISDLAKEAARGPRKWTPSTPITGPTTPVNLNNATLTANGVTFVGLSSSTALITLTPASGVSAPMIIYTAQGSVISRNAAGTAIGVCGEAPAVCNNTTAQLANPEYLAFLLTTLTAQKLSLGLQNFGAGESLQVVFRNLGVPVGDPVTVAFPTLPTGLVPTTDAAFDEVIVTPQGASAFFIQSIQFCDAASAC